MSTSVRRFPWLFAVTVLLAGVGCASPEQTSLLLTVEAPPGTTIVSLSAALRLGGDAFESPQALGGAMPRLPGRLLVPLADVAQSLEVKLAALDEHGQGFGGLVEVLIEPHRQLGRTVVLSDTCPGGECVPATDTPTWTSVAALPSPRYELTLVRGLDDVLYATGGADAYGGPPMAALFAFDPSSQAWRTLTPDPVARANASAVALLDGRMAVIGGEDETQVFARCDAYDPGTHQWSSLPALPMPRSRATAIRDASGAVLLPGGIAAFASTPVPLDVTLQLKDGAWRNGPHLPEGRLKSAAVLLDDGRACVLGGVDGDFLASMVCLTADQSRWETQAPMMTSRFGLAAVRGGDGRIYAVAGVEGGNVSASVVAYGPSVTATPSTVEKGTQVTIDGDNFAKNAVVLVYLEDDLSAPISRGTSDERGHLSAPITFAMPAHDAGPIELRVVDHRSAYPAFAQLRLTNSN